METAALDTAHIEIALIHKRLDKKGERLAACPERWIRANMWPERLHQLEAPTNVGDDLWQNGCTPTGEHSQCHIWAWSHHIHKFLQGEVRSNGFIAIFGVFEQREGIA